MRRSALLLTCVLACSSRSAPPPGAAGPVEAAQEFASALQRGDAASASALLSTRTQRAADQIAAKARAEGAGASGVPDTGRQMLFGSALPQGKVEVREIARQGDVAQVEVIDANHQARTYRLVRENDVWKIDLDLTGADGGR